MCVLVIFLLGELLRVQALVIFKRLILKALKFRALVLAHSSVELLSTESVQDLVISDVFGYFLPFFVFLIFSVYVEVCNVKLRSLPPLHSTYIADDDIYPSLRISDLLRNILSVL